MVGSLGFRSLGIPDVEILIVHFCGVTLLNLQLGRAVVIQTNVKIFAIGLLAQCGFVHIAAVGKLDAHKGVPGAGFFLGATCKTEQRKDQKKQKDSFRNMPPFCVCI